MKLRTKLLALSLVTLLLPWAAWMLLQELEHFLRDSQENALLSSARTLAGALPLEFQGRLMFAPELSAPLRPLPQAPVLDGYVDEWPEAGQGLEFSSDDGEVRARLLAGRAGGLVQLFLTVSDGTPVRTIPGAAEARGDTVHLMVRTARGMQSWTISPEAPGPVRVRSLGAEGGELEGYWLETAADPGLGTEAGYSLEVTLPVPVGAADPALELAIDIIDAQTAGAPQARRFGTASDGRPQRWVSLTAPWIDLSEWLATTAPSRARTWLVDKGGWVLADSGARDTEAGQTTWIQRLLYRAVSDERPRIEEPWSEPPVRLTAEFVKAALAGSPGSDWSQDLDSAVVRNTVAVPLSVQGKVRGGLVMQARSDGLLLITNRALGRLLLTTLALMLGLVAGLWYFASRLSRRVERLSGSVSRAMDSGVPETELPLVGDRDELGELARNNARLLRAVADYNQYLQTLAGKLSHELKTPLAITRSSLDNLASLPLDDEARRFLDRALEGLDRQGEIVRAMAEASRLEQAIESAEWNRADLTALLAATAEGYRALHPERHIETRLPQSPVWRQCAPDLIVQALDKLLDNAVTLSGSEDRITIILDHEDGLIRLGVANTGSRLPQSLQDRLFDSLVSVRQHRGRAPHLGLGLYIVRLVAEAHGGRAMARNLAGGDGVEFTIALPTDA